MIGGHYETFMLEAGEIERFARSAAPNELLVYARSSRLPKGSQAAATARALADGGQLRLHHRPSTNGLTEYLAYRRLQPASRAPRPLTRHRPVLDADMARLLRLLRLLARTGKPCPNNEQLGRITGIGTRERVAYTMRKLTLAGLITSTIVATGSQARVITIVATGRQTAMPEAA